MEDLSQLTIGNNNYTLKDGEARSSINEIVTAIQLNNSSISTHINDLNTRVDELESYEKKYLTFVALESGTFKYTSTSLNVSFSYSLDNGKTFTELASNTNTPTVTAGQKILWKGTAPSSGYNNSWVGIGRFSSSNKFDVEGNIMSLAYGDNFYGENDLTNKKGIFYYLFSQCGNKIINAKNLILPALTLSDSCYFGMFDGCSALLTSPKIIPATTLDSMCCAYMFQNCSALTIAPELPAITLASGCYNSMFYNCSSLTKAPELSARTLASSCYSSMFKNCSSLGKTPELPATTLAYNCYSNMFDGCELITDMPELPAITLTINCYMNMFSRCIKLKNVSKLPATVLADYCYNGMFKNCTQLTAAPELPATTLTAYCYNNMFNGCIMLSYIKALFTTTPTSSNTGDWVNNVSGSGIFVKNNNAEWDVTGVDGIPENWTIYNSNEYRYAYKYELDNLDLTNVNLGDENIIEDIKLNNIPITPSNKSVNIKTSEYINKYFSIINRQTLASYIKFDMNGSANLYYSNDEGETWNLYTSGDTIKLPGTGTSSSQTYDDKTYSKVMFKGNLITLNPNNNSYAGIGTFSVPENSSSGVIDVEGNIMSLLYGDDFINDNKNKDNNSYTTIKNYQFKDLFNGFTLLKNANNLILPTYKLSTGCYKTMFYNCSRLVFPPKILAKVISTESFRGMFANCTSLVETAKVEAYECYDRCFYEIYSNCSSLTKAYDIICKNISGEQNFYRYFYNCTSLVIAPQIYVNALTYKCFHDMFNSCRALKVPPKLPWTTLANNCYEGMFLYCSSLEETPELPATTLCPNCYYKMFGNCSNLLRASLPNFTMANNCCEQMFAWCDNLQELMFLSTDDYSNYTNACREMNYHHGNKLKVILNNSQTWFDKSSNNPFCNNIYVYTYSDWEIVRKKNLKDVYDAIGYKDQYLTFIALTAGVLRFNRSFLYSIDNGNIWKEVAANEDTEVFSINTKILCKAVRSSQNGNGIGTFNYKSKAEEDAASATYEGTEEEQAEAKAAAIAAANKIIQAKIEGNPMSMRYGDDFHNKLLENYAYQKMFIYNTNIINAHNLSLDWSYVKQKAYAEMFRGCTNLVTAPKLPAKILESEAYSNMFYGCSSLVNPPELPATDLGTSCYYQMFYGCSSLTKAPKLPAIVLNNYCYNSMFYNCTSLVEAPELPVITLALGCYHMMFKNCTSLVKAPELPASILVEKCYYNMFYGCSSLKYVKALFTDCSATNCLTEWFANASNTGNEIFIKSDGNINWPSSRITSTVPSNWKIYNESEWESPHRYELNVFAKTCEDIGAVIDYSKQYLTFIAKENGTFTFTPRNSNVISYSTDNGNTWTVGNSVQVNSGDKVMWKGEMTPNSNGIGSFSESTNNFDVQGNIMSLLYGDNFNNQTDLSGKNFVFCELFQNTKIVNAENLSLPATTLAEHCYNSMFNNCRLISAPKLPATTLADGCYHYMFCYCINLTVAPKLPATTLAYSCYYGMFYNCTNLTVAPELPAIILEQYCYYSMFYNCTNLTAAPELPATTLANSCYNSMFDNCTSLTIAPELPATTLEQYCYYRMFANCTSLTTAPKLPATTLANNCYYAMFGGCTNLNSITCLATNISASSCTIYWVSGVAANGTFIKAASMSNWTTNDSGIPTGWDVYTEDEYKIIRKYELNGYVKNIKLNNNFLTKENGTVNIEISGLGLPTVTSSDNGKILMVINGAWALVSPSVLYTGNGVPNNIDGNNGDLYIETDNSGSE